MKNKRLLIVLCIFIVVGSVAIFGSAVFAVNNITVNFHNDLDFFIPDYAVTEDQRRAAEAALEDDIRASLSFMMGRNLLFNMDERRIRSTIEDSDPATGGTFKGFRLRVTNVEAVFPNRIVVTVRERYPVFKYTEGSHTVVMDGTLRVLDRRPLPGNRDVVMLCNIGAGDRTNIFVNTNVATVPVGGYLESEYIYFDQFVRALGRVVPFFARIGNMEDAVTDFLYRIEFTYRYGQNVDLNAPQFPTLVLIQRVPTRDSSPPMNYFVMYIIDADYRTEDKLAMLWDVRSYRRSLGGDVAGNGVYTVLDWSGHHGWLNRVPPRGLVVEFVLPGLSGQPPLATGVYG